MKKPLIYLIAILSILLLNACLKDAPFKLEYEGYEPTELTDGIEISTPEQEDMNPEYLNEAYQLLYTDDRFMMARSLLVYRNGKLVAEAYPNDKADIGKIYNIQSCTKSITSIITGIAIHENLIDSLDEPLFNIYPENFDNDPRKRSITLKDALVMQTGLDFDNGYHTLELFNTTTNSAAYVLSQDYLQAPGVLTNYNDGAPQLISKALEKKVGKTLGEYANEKLFSPLGITDWKWESAKDNSSFGAFSLYLKPRDFGRIGQLLIQGGKYDAKRIIDSSYLEQATSVQVAANFSHEPYGYYFWILPAFNGYAALGHGGQFLLIIPEKDLVVVYTAWPYTSGNYFDQSNDLMTWIIASCN